MHVHSDGYMWTFRNAGRWRIQPVGAYYCLISVKISFVGACIYLISAKGSISQHVISQHVMVPYNNCAWSTARDILSCLLAVRIWGVATWTSYHELLLLVDRKWTILFLTFRCSFTSKVGYLIMFWKGKYSFRFSFARDETGNDWNSVGIFLKAEAQLGGARTVYASLGLHSSLALVAKQLARSEWRTFRILIAIVSFLSQWVINLFY